MFEKKFAKVWPIIDRGSPISGWPEAWAPGLVGYATVVLGAKETRWLSCECLEVEPFMSMWPPVEDVYWILTSDVRDR
jgi:hypothetical protein